MAHSSAEQPEGFKDFEMQKHTNKVFRSTINGCKMSTKWGCSHAVFADVRGEAGRLVCNTTVSLTNNKSIHARKDT